MHHRMLVTTALAGLLVCLEAAAVATDHPDLSGRWTVNAELSANLKDKFKELYKGRPRPQFDERAGSDDDGQTPEGSPNPGRLGMFWSGRPARSPQPADPAEQGGMLWRLVAAAALDITQSAIVTIRYGEGIERSLTPNPDGQVYTASGKELSRDAIGDSLTFWDAATLVVETHAPDGARLIERFQASPAEGRLTVTFELKIRGRTQPLSLTRVYDRRAASTGDPAM